MIPHRDCFHWSISDKEVFHNLEHYGCPEEICPVCYLPKRHDDRLCRPCVKYQNRLWRAVWRWIPHWLHRRWERWHMHHPSG